MTLLVLARVVGASLLHADLCWMRHYPSLARSIDHITVVKRGFVT